MAPRAGKKKRAPRILTPEVQRQLCDWIAEGGTMRSFCRESRLVTRQGVWKALQSDPDFDASYRRARLFQMEGWADEIIEEADYDAYDHEGAHRVNRSRLRVDTRKWLLARRHPEYVDKTQLQGAGGGALEIRWAGDPDPEDRG